MTLLGGVEFPLKSPAFGGFSLLFSQNDSSEKMGYADSQAQRYNTASQKVFHGKPSMKMERGFAMNMKSALLVGALLAVMVIPCSFAQGQVRIGIGIGVPVYSRPYYQPYPYYYGYPYYPPPRVYVAPQPVYVTPAPVYAQPAPVYAQPTAVYAQPGQAAQTYQTSPAAIAPVPSSTLAPAPQPAVPAASSTGQVPVTQ